MWYQAWPTNWNTKQNTKQNWPKRSCRVFSSPSPLRTTSTTRCDRRVASGGSRREREREKLGLVDVNEKTDTHTHTQGYIVGIIHPFLKKSMCYWSLQGKLALSCSCRPNSTFLFRPTFKSFLPSFPLASLQCVLAPGEEEGGGRPYLALFFPPPLLLLPFSPTPEKKNNKNSHRLF